MSRRVRRAVPPTAEQLKAREENKQKERDAIKAAPPQPRESDNHKCAGQLYKVAGKHVVHGKNKGETVTLCPHTGVTKALVFGGHLVPVQSATVKAVTASSVAPKAADPKGADHG